MISNEPITGEQVCFGKGGLFFPEKETIASTRAARYICQHECPSVTRTECLAGALERKEEFGVWGGESTRQRRARLNHPFVRPDVNVLAGVIRELGSMEGGASSL